MALIQALTRSWACSVGVWRVPITDMAGGTCAVGLVATLVASLADFADASCGSRERNQRMYHVKGALGPLAQCSSTKLLRGTIVAIPAAKVTAQSEEGLRCN